jgi:dTDP-4-amino-4,6-dideoxygalactose transaminase
MKIPLVDLQAQYKSIKTEVNEAIEVVLTKGDYILGQAVGQFEAAFAEFSKAKYVISCANGTDALYLALKALDIGPGDEVISVSNTWVSTIFAISNVGATPVFVDIDPNTYQIDANLIEAAITPKTKAILPVHLYGHPAPMQAIQQIAAKHGLKVIEDAAQAHGARIHGQPIGSFSDITCYSFYPGKNLGAYGDAGAVTTNNPELAEKLELLRGLGQKTKHHHEIIGVNSRLDTLQAAILNVKIKYLATWSQQRRDAAKRYDDLLKGMDCQIPGVDQNALPVYHLYVIQVDNRDAVLEALQEQGVMAQIHYPNPVHLQPCYQSLNTKTDSLPHTERVAKRIISLPIYPEITPAQQQYVAESLSKTITS